MLWMTTGVRLPEDAFRFFPLAMFFYCAAKAQLSAGRIFDETGDIRTGGQAQRMLPIDTCTGCGETLSPCVKDDNVVP